MAGDESGGPQVRLVLGPVERARRARDLWLAVGICDLLLVAIVLVGVSAGWPWWGIALAGALPLLVGAAALRGAIVMRRAGLGSPGTDPAGGAER